MTKYVVIFVALLGLGLGIWTVATSGRRTPPLPPVQAASVNPFASGIAADGLVEAASRNVNIAAPEPGLVTRVFVQVNDRVKKGDALFQIDPRPLEADLDEARAAAAVARAQLARLEAAPRAEDVPIQKAAVAGAKAQLAYAQSQYRYTQKAYGQGAATTQELDRRRAQFRAARAKLVQVQAELAKLEAGSWKQDIKVARAQEDEARAKIAAIELRLGRLTVRSPIDATILKRNIEPGEYAAVSNDTPTMVIGNLDELHIRAKVDEEDAPKLRPGERGVAEVRGAFHEHIPLTMLRIEPLAEPKKQLTGVSTELVDTRVIDVVFKVDNPEHKNLHIYPGQLVDVFIQGPPTTEPATGPTTEPGAEPAGGGGS